MSAFEGRIPSVILADECSGFATACDLRIHAVNGFTLRNAVSRDSPPRFSGPVEKIFDRLSRSSFIDVWSAIPEAYRSAEVVCEDYERNNVQARAQPNHASCCDQRNERTQGGHQAPVLGPRNEISRSARPDSRGGRRVEAVRSVETSDFCPSVLRQRFMMTSGYSSCSIGIRGGVACGAASEGSDPIRRRSPLT